MALYGLTISFLSLKHRQEQWKKDEAERIANTPDPSVPEGHRVLPENERRDTLSLLRKSKLFMGNRCYLSSLAGYKRLNSLHAGYFFTFFFVICRYFLIFFPQKSNVIKVLNVLGPNCLRRLSAGNKNHLPSVKQFGSRSGPPFC